MAAFGIPTAGTRLLGYQAAALVPWSIELGIRKHYFPNDHGHLIGHSLLVLLSWATLLAVALEGLRWVGVKHHRATRGRLPATLPFWLGALPVFYWLGSQGVKGAWISRQPIAAHGPTLVVIAGGLCLAAIIYVDAKLSASPRKPVRLGWAVALALGALGCIAVDFSYLQGLYEFLHDALAGCSWLALGRSASLVTADWLRGSALPSRRRALWVVVPLSLSLSIPLSFVLRAGLEPRTLWSAMPMLSGRLHQRASTLAYLYRGSQAQRGLYPTSLEQFVAKRNDAAALAPERTLQLWRSLRAGGGSSAHRATGPKPHVVLVTVDALRADVAYAQGESFARIAQRGLRFDYAFAPSASTQGALVTAFHGTLAWRQSPRHLLDALHEVGYTSAIATARALPDYLHTRGQRWLSDFQHPRTVGRPTGTRSLTDLVPHADPTSAEITQEAMALLSLADSGPLFLWVHYFDLHEWEGLTASGGGDKRARYERIFRDVDREISRLLDAVDRALPKERTVVVLSSDHGEYLGENGRWGHTRYVGLPGIHVPLVMQAPGVEPQRRPEPVALIDLGPTLAGFAGAPLEGADGCDLLTLGCRGSSAYIVASDAYELAVVAEHRLLVVSPRMEAVALYDYRNDPRGDHNLHASEPERAAQMLAVLLGSPMARLGTSFLE
jgi:hypothetical protein